MPPGPGEGEAGVSRMSALHTHSTLTAPEVEFCGKKKKKTYISNHVGLGY